MRELLERAVAACALVAMSPLLGAISVLVKATSKGPLLYEPEMLGRDGRTFRLKKFRSMVVGAKPIITSGAKILTTKNDLRFTPIGSVLRIGFDELPQLINIARGEMSFVGPRPDPAWLLPRYTPLIQERLRAKPGITGLAQVFDGRVQPGTVIYYLDVHYSKNHSIGLDFSILLATIPYVLGFRSVGAKFFGHLLEKGRIDIPRYELLPAEQENVAP
jgi:lipopolysaccharide/colanic/teichoic acid biosynthesis glycosyltransferase